jgi:hypothetical protein
MLKKEKKEYGIKNVSDRAQKINLCQTLFKRFRQDKGVAVSGLQLSEAKQEISIIFTMPDKLDSLA